MASMQNRFPAHTLIAAAAACLAGTLTGCGLARDLTTQHRTYAYTVSLPPVPANTMGQGQVTLDEQVQNTYQKYHGGVDWTRLAYQAQNSSTLQPSTLKLYASLTGSVPATQLDQQATLFETITLAPSESRTVTLAQAPNNDALRAFLASALSQRSESTIYFYAAASSTDPSATVTVQSFTAQVQVHGSYF
jgi:hypothetical protein